jgi:predicted metal-dependent phosphoesterase TrpH
MFKKGDFHVHSTASDGKLTPTEVIEFSKERGVDIISLTDHNTTSGLEEAMEVGETYGVTVIPGIELATRYRGAQVHMLGYFKDDGYKNKTFQEVIRLIKGRKIKSAKRLLKGIVDIDIDNNKLSVLSGITLLKSFGAIVVLAHPVTINKNYLKEILEFPFDGIEAKYYRNSIDETKFFLQLSKQLDKFYTAGSDFHTNKKRDLRHGLIGETYLNSKEIEKFLKESTLIHSFGQNKFLENVAPSGF